MQTAISMMNWAAAGTQGEAARTEPLRFRKRIGSTVYEVNVHFNQDAKETMNDKILRLVRNGLNPPQKHAKLNQPQTGWLPERSSA